MSDIAQGPGWWRASDGRWYPPEQHPTYLSSLPPPPPAHQVPFAAPPTVAATGQPARVSLTATTCLLALGALGVFVSVFLTWATATVDDGFGITSASSADLTGVGKFLGVAVALAVVALSAPVFVGGAVSRKRIIGLAVMVAVFTVLAGVWTANASHSLRGASNESPAAGTFACWTAIVLIWVGLIGLWRRRRNQGAAVSPGA